MSLLQSLEAVSSAAAFGTWRASYSWECTGTSFRVKKLDSSGMKYTHWILRLLAVTLATFLGTSQLRAQSAYVSGSPSLAAANTTIPAADATAVDEPQTSIVTLHSRVNEVNVLFIAT